MKVVAINGSPNKNGNTAFAVETAAKELREAGIEVEVLQVGSENIRGCLSCGGCIRNQDKKCVQRNDKVNEYIQKMEAADGILLGSPVYFSGLNGTMKAFLDRSFFVASVNGGLFRHKVGACVAAVRRGGGVTTYEQLYNFINYSEMIVASSNYWNVIHGNAAGEAEQDAEGVQIMRVLGKNMAWILKLVENGKGTVAEPEAEPKVFTNFIR